MHTVRVMQDSNGAASVSPIGRLALPSSISVAWADRR